MASIFAANRVQRPRKREEQNQPISRRAKKHRMQFSDVLEYSRLAAHVFQDLTISKI